MRQLTREGRHHRQSRDQFVYTFNATVTEMFSYGLEDWEDWTSDEVVRLLAGGIEERGEAMSGRGLRPMSMRAWRAEDHAMEYINRTTGLEELMGGVVMSEAGVDRRTPFQAASYACLQSQSRRREREVAGKCPGSKSGLKTRARNKDKGVGVRSTKSRSTGVPTGGGITRPGQTAGGRAPCHDKKRRGKTFPPSSSPTFTSTLYSL